MEKQGEKERRKACWGIWLEKIAQEAEILHNRSWSSKTDLEPAELGDKQLGFLTHALSSPDECICILTEGRKQGRLTGSVWTQGLDPSLILRQNISRNRRRLSLTAEQGAKWGAGAKRT